MFLARFAGAVRSSAPEMLSLTNDVAMLRGPRSPAASPDATDWNARNVTAAADGGVAAIANRVADGFAELVDEGDRVVATGRKPWLGPSLPRRFWRP
jgi:hypothetical protein